MGQKILVVAEVEGFIVKGLEAKLKGIGMDVLFSSPKLRELQEKSVDVDLFIAFAEDDISNITDALVLIKDNCVERDKKVLVIGDKNGYEALTHFIPGACILDNFARPIDMEKLLDKVENYMAEETQISKRKSILIVDDDVAYMSMIMDWLKEKYRVSLANSGMEAITWLAGNDVDLILLDYEMPITSGPQVMQMIKSSPKTSDIPIMFLTGKADKASIMAVLSLKPAGYLLKTVDKKGLYENIDGYFATQKAKV